MEKKKRYLLNCEVCDARKMHENLFDPYDEVVINADVLLVNEDARRNLSRYPIQLNVDNIVEAEGDVDVQVQNGWMELKCGQMPEKNSAGGQRRTCHFTGHGGTFKKLPCDYRQRFCALPGKSFGGAYQNEGQRKNKCVSG